MELVDKIKIDIVRKGNTPVVYAVQGESLSRVVSADILSNGFPVNVRGQKASVVYKKPDGTSGWYDRVQDGTSAIKPQIGSIDYNISAKIAPQMLTVPGIVYAAIRIEEQDGSKRATTFPFIVDVAEDPGYNAPKSENYYNVQNWGDVNQKIKEIEDTISSFSYVIDDLVIDKKTTWSSKNIVDMLCPDIEESGSVVMCEPVEGYPLDVVSAIDPKEDGTTWSEIKLTNCGKNFLKFPYYYDSRTINGVTFTVNADGTVTANGTSTAAATFYLARDSMTEGLFLPVGKFTLSGCPAGGSHSTYRMKASGNTYGLDAYDIGSGVTSSTKEARSCTGLSIQIMKAGVTLDNVVFKPQIEVGSVATGYEPYYGKTYTADLTDQGITEGEYNWKTGVLTDAEGNETQTEVHDIAAYPGTNTLLSDCGNTSVSGKADPAAIIDKLTNAIIALGGNV